MPVDTWSLRSMVVSAFEGVVMGLVSAEGAAQIEVEWDNRETQRVEMINRSFLVLREEPGWYAARRFWMRMATSWQGRRPGIAKGSGMRMLA
jgi:hypothetical protein